MKQVAPDNLILPLYIPETDADVDQIPSGSFVLGRKGICILQRGDLLSSIKHVDCQALVNVDNMVKYSGAKLDAPLFAMAYLVFQIIFNRHKTEAQALIYRKGTEFWLRVPRQKVSGATVSYELSDKDLWFHGNDSCAEPEGVEPFGTIHSHSSMSAFFSGTDDRDHAISPGIHLVIGQFYEQTVVEPGKRLKVEPPAKGRIRGRVSGGGSFSTMEPEELAEMETSILVMPNIPEDLVNVNTAVTVGHQWSHTPYQPGWDNYEGYDRAYYGYPSKEPKGYRSQFKIPPNLHQKEPVDTSDVDMTDFECSLFELEMISKDMHLTMQAMADTAEDTALPSEEMTMVKEAYKRWTDAMQRIQELLFVYGVQADDFEMADDPKAGEVNNIVSTKELAQMNAAYAARTGFGSADDFNALYEEDTIHSRMQKSTELTQKEG